MQTFCGITTDGMLEYLAAIYKLGVKGERVTNTVLSEYMNVSAAAASSMLKRLEESLFVERSTSGVKLTEQGRLAAMQMIRRHRLLEVFLIRVMGYTWDQVDNEAHRLEHAISASFEDRMDALCGYPTHCPHGDPIPRKDGSLPDHQPLVAVTGMEVGQAGVVQRVGLTDSRVLRYLAGLNLVPGQAIRLVDLAPFRGPVTIVCDQATQHNNTTNQQVIGYDLAEQLFVIPN